MSDDRHDWTCLMQACRRYLDAFHDQIADATVLGSVAKDLHSVVSEVVALDPAPTQGLQRRANEARDKILTWLAADTDTVHDLVEAAKLLEPAGDPVPEVTRRDLADAIEAADGEPQLGDELYDHIAGFLLSRYSIHPRIDQKREAEKETSD